MKTRKTRIDRRDTYTYIDAMGEKRTLRPGDIDPDSGYVLTEEDIKRLHRMDDNEVYNNVKNMQTPIQDWEKPILEAWKADHPGEELPTRKHISINIINEDDEGSTEDADKGLIARASIARMSVEDPMIERLHEVVEMLRPEQRDLYKRIVIEGERPSAIAKELGVDKSAITHRMNAIKKNIERFFC